jgi:perosamine synthetase
MIPLGKPAISEMEKNAVLRVLESGLLATGQVVREFEDACKVFIGKSHAIAVNSGTVALAIAIRVNELKQVILPAITCPEVLNAVLFAGAAPVIVDVEPGTHNLDPGAITADQLRDADGIIATNAYGHPARIDEIRELCRDHDLLFIEDFAQSNGAFYRGRRCGSFGEVSVTSFYAGKTMTTGHGGMVFTDSPGLAMRVRHARGDEPYASPGPMIPLNFKMTDFQAAMGIEQLRRIDTLVDMRREVALRYAQGLSGVGGIRLPGEQEFAHHCYYKYALMLERVEKHSFIRKMKALGIQTGILYEPPLHQVDSIRELGFRPQTLPVAEQVARSCVSLPIYALMTADETDTVINAIKQVVKV